MPSILVLDNGLRKISNLNPVSLSLQVLCLCDQVIRTLIYLQDVLKSILFMPTEYNRHGKSSFAAAT